MLGKDMLPEWAAVTVQHLTKRFETGKSAITAIRDLNLTVKKGEFLCIVGPSGCGKTTFIRIIAGLERHTEGEVYVAHNSPGRPLTAMVFQTDSLFPWMTVENNVGYGLMVRRVTKTEREQRVSHFLSMTGLSAFRKNYPHELSGGMRQRVNVARAFAVDPEILLMDEPFGLLDEQNRLILQKELMQIWQETRKTAIFITHSVDEAILLGDRVMVMTASPGTVKSIIEIPLQRPRDMIALRSDPVFISLYREIWNQLSEEVRKSRELTPRESRAAAKGQEEPRPACP